MTTRTFDIGDAPTATVEFTDNDAPADPDTVTFQVKAPDGTVTTLVSPDPAITNPAVGEWVLQLDAFAASGTWHVRAAGTGTVIAAGEARMWVRPSNF